MALILAFIQERSILNYLIYFQYLSPAWTCSPIALHLFHICKYCSCSTFSTAKTENEMQIVKPKNLRCKVELEELQINRLCGTWARIPGRSLFLDIMCDGIWGHTCIILCTAWGTACHLCNAFTGRWHWRMDISHLHTKHYQTKNNFSKGPAHSWPSLCLSDLARPSPSLIGASKVCALEILPLGKNP